MDNAARCTTEIVRDVVVLHLSGPVEMSGADALREEILAVIQGSGCDKVVLDLRNVPLVDSSGLGLFMSLVQQYSGSKRIRFCNMAGNVRAVFDYMGIATYLDLDPVLEDSLATLIRSAPPPKSARKTPGKPLSLAGKYILNEAGQRYCAQLRIPVRDLRTFAGERAIGFDWKVCRLDLLKKLVVHGLITTIEISKPEFVSARHALLDLTRTILCGILYKRFRPELKRRLRLTPEAARIAEDPEFIGLIGDRAAMASALRRRAVWTATLRTSIEEECAARTRAGIPEAICDEETLARVSSLMDEMDDETALLLALGGADLVGAASDVVYSYARRVEIAEHLCLMLMEFIQLAEKSFLINLAERELFVRNHPEELERMLAEEAFRDRLRERAVQRGELMLLRMDFSGTVMDPADPAVIRIMVRNRGLIGYGSRLENLGRRPRTVKENTMDQILSADEEGGGLGLIYHTLLRAKCAAEGMDFSTSVVRNEKEDETIAVMSLTL
ncbi:MAG TPA: STAS domain-containing protein [Magnetospirillaceae bacterium]|nr:STAS domain-containing protein [Magnetospirillaceae bacterium]